jgi:hypothetical protein
LTKLARFALPMMLALSVVLGACAQAPAQPTQAPAAVAAAPTNTVAPPTAAPTNTTAPAATNTAAPAPTNTSVPAPTNTAAPAPTNTAAPAKPSAAPAVAAGPRGLIEEWVKTNPEFTKDSKIVGEGSPDGKAFLVQLSPPAAKPGDPSLITVGVYQSETAAAANAQLAKLGDAMKADGFTREESKELLGTRDAITGGKGSADAAEGYVLFQANDRVGIVQVALPIAQKDVVNGALGSIAASLILQLDPTAQVGAAPAKPAVQAVVGTPKELLARWLQSNPAMTADGVVEEQPGADAKSSLVVIRPKTADPKGLQSLTFGIHQADSVAAAPALVAKLGDARRAEGWTIDPSPVAQLGARATAIGSKESAGMTTVFLFFQANDRVGLVEATGPMEMGAATIAQIVGVATGEMLKSIDPSFQPAPAKAP